MTTIPRRWRRSRGGSLTDAVARLRPPVGFTVSIGHVIGDWATLEEPTATLAQPRAEAHIHDYLAQAHAEGYRHGKSFAKSVLWPATGLVVVLSSVLLALS